MSEHRRRIDQVLDPSYLVDLPEWRLNDLRRRHLECLEIETEVSYVRRMTQARIDILEAELDRRARGGSVIDLIARRPEILADDGPRAPVEKSRLNRRLAPSMDIQWRRGREHLITDDTLATLPNLDDDELRIDDARARPAGAGGVAATTPASPGDRPHGRRVVRPPQSRPGVSTSSE
jgi:hypothetical protein